MEMEEVRRTFKMWRVSKKRVICNRRKYRQEEQDKINKENRKDS